MFKRRAEQQQYGVLFRGKILHYLYVAQYRKQSGWRRSVVMLALKGNVSAAAELADRAEGRSRPTITVAHQEIGAGLIVRNWKNFDRDGRPRTAHTSAAYVHLLTPDGGRRHPPNP